MLTAGTQLGPYKILAPLGAGGMGEVYRAQDERLGREVALKILSARFAEDQDRLARFQREAKAVAALAHPNIVVVYDFGTAQGVTFAISELLEGETLRQRLTHAALPWRKAVELAVAIADGLAAAHAKGIVHRDVKPDNIFVTADERVKILDFGLAKLLAESPAAEPVQTQDYSPVLTKTGTILGTAPYMSPEQLRDQPVDARSDIFSLGCTLYEMVAGKRPFTGKTDADVRAAILHNDPAELTDSGKKVPVELERLIRRCLEKNPEARFQSARDWAYALRGIATDSAEVRPAPRPIWSRSSIGLAAGAVLLALLVLGVVFFRNNPSPTPLNSGRADAAAPIEVAILPFANHTKDAETDYLSDGLADGIIKCLSQVGQLNVRSFNTVSRFRGPVIELEEVGRKLKVQAVLLGKILPRKDGFTLSVELVKVATDSVLWSERYDTKPADLQTVQLAIARQVCANLKVTMTPQEEKRFAKRHTDNGEAHQQYLVGRHYYFKRNLESLKKAEECFLRAIKIDSKHALAYAGLADTYRAWPELGGIDRAAEAKTAAQQSLALDDQLAEAHTALGSILFYEWDWHGAEKELKLGVELNPSLALSWDWYFGYLLHTGRFAEAELAARKAIQLDPVTPYISIDLPMLHVHTRQFDLAIQEYYKILEVDPEYAEAYYGIGRSLVDKGQHREALAAFQKYRQLWDTSNGQAFVAFGHALCGEKEEALKLLDELTAKNKQGLVDPSYIAVIHMALGEKDLACDWLEKAYAQRSRRLVWLKYDPIYDSLQAEPRFIEIVKKMKFP